MPSCDLIIRNGKILSSGGITESDICISDGKIVAIQRSGSNDSPRSIDAKGSLVLPGLIDPHVHFRDPGLTKKEDFVTGTKGAVAGGVTTVFDMPTTMPVVTTASLFREKLSVVRAKSLANFGLIAAASDANLDEIPRLAAEGAIAFKTYMVSPPKERTREYEGSFIKDSGSLLRTMREVAKTQRVHCIHAESDSTIACLTEDLVSAGRKDPMAHYDSRPNFTEEEAVYEALLLCKVLRAKVHIVHVSTSGATSLLSGARKNGIDASAETCPHYLCFTKELLKTKGPLAKYNPPARNLEDTKFLLNALNDGTIDMVSTDHAPHTLEEKELGQQDIFRAPPGTPGVETRLPILLKMASDNLLRLEDIPRITSESVARRFGLIHKGRIEEGFDADLAIVDYSIDWKIKASDLQTKAWEVVLYDGMEVKGRVRHTLVGGEEAFGESSGFSKPGTGSFVRA
jgi:allantoinase